MQHIGFFIVEIELLIVINIIISIINIIYVFIYNNECFYQAKKIAV